MAKKEKKKHPVPQAAGFLRWSQVTAEQKADWAKKQGGIMRRWWKKQTGKQKNVRAQKLAKARGLKTYSEGQIKEVIKLLQQGLPSSEIAKKTKVHKMTIAKVATGKNWTWLTEGLNLRRRPKQKAKLKVKTEKKKAA